ncbi:obscurin-like [Spea bombifrons]|uniref:obscurin-like n=1 Tax=Spea bombifrons TaxID=233779 RepID=UPI00234BD789|nr:obscurin-like [Spea bombifrons]
MGQGGPLCLEDSIRASLERADQEIRHVLKKLVDSPGTTLAAPQEESPENVGAMKHGDGQYLEAEPKNKDLFRDADTQTPDVPAPETGENGKKSAAGIPETRPAFPSQTPAGSQEHQIPIRLEMDAAERYLRGSGGPAWDVRTQLYIEATQTTSFHLKEENATSPPYMHVTVEDVQVHHGDPAQFDAVIEGAAPLTVTWYKNNILVKESERVQVLKEDRRYSLILRVTEREDAGVYTCVARNAGGEVSCKAELVMHEDKKEQVSKKPHKRRKLKSFFEVKEEIGRGSFGFVKRVVHKGNGMTCAAKFIPLRSKTRLQAYRERDILSEVTHSNVTLLLDTFQTKKTLILILEICYGEELLNRLFRKNTVTEKEVKVYIRQILEAVAYLHDKNILHLDIKPSNILMVHPDEDNLKLCDFGFAQKINTSELQYSKYGSPEFISPEIACLSPVSKASDIWPVGVITYLSLVCASPFAGQNDRESLLNVQRGRISWSCQGFTQLSEEAKDFMKRTIQMSPETRPAALDCLQHTWFQEGSILQETRRINMKGLKFLVARSRWQRSLMSYKSILVMRSIPELLQGKVESTSLGVPRHLVEGSSSSSTSGSSSDNESDISPTVRDCNPSLELHLSIFKMADQDRLQEQEQHMLEIERAGDEEGLVQEMKKGDKESTLTTSDMNDQRKADEAVGLGGSRMRLEETDEMLVDNVQTSPGKPPLFKAATIEMGDLASQKGRSGCFIRGKSADSALAGDVGVDRTQIVCVPRQSIINSTFYTQVSEGPGSAPREGSLKEKEFIRHRERARRSLMRAGYSPKILSGLREPLLEQFAMEQGIVGHGLPATGQDVQLGSLKKSMSFDTGKGSLRSSFKVSSRSRSLDDSKSRPLSVYRGPLVEEEDADAIEDPPNKVNKPDVSHKLCSKEPILADDPSKGAIEPNKETIEWRVTQDSNQHSVPSSISSTQRPLSAAPTENENTIIAVLHQHPPQYMGSGKEGPPSAAHTDSESTVIAFVKQRNSPIPETTQPPATLCHADSNKDLQDYPQSTAGRVKFTVQTIPTDNSYLFSPTEKLPDSAQCQEGIPKESTTKADTQTSLGAIHTVQFIDHETSIAVIHQGASDISSDTKRDLSSPQQIGEEYHVINIKRPVMETMKGLITETQTTGGPLEKGGPTDVLAADVPSCEAHDRHLQASTSQVDVEDTPMDGVRLRHADNKTKSCRSPTLGHDMKETFLKGDNVGAGFQSSGYSPEQSTALDSLVGEMTDLSEEMEVLAHQEDQEPSAETPPFPLVDSQSPTPAEMERKTCMSENYCAMETEPPIRQLYPSNNRYMSETTSVSQCSFYETLCQDQPSPIPQEQFEEFTTESLSSSRTLISQTSSSGTGRRSDNFSDFDETGRQSEVSLVEIEEIRYEPTTTISEHATPDVKPTRSHLLELYDIDGFPIETSVGEEEFSSEVTKLNWSSLTSPQPGAFKQKEPPSDQEPGSCGPPQSLQPSDPCKSTGKERKSSGSRKRIKLFRPHGKSEPGGKPSEQSLKQKMKASVANISRIIKGKQGNGQERKGGTSEATKAESTDQASTAGLPSQAKKKSALPSLKFPNLTGKDKAPAFVEELTDQTVAVGHLVTLSCRTAQPVADIEWFKDGLPIHSSERVLISSTHKNYHLLTILVVNSHDLGIYACVAANALGSASTCCIIKKAGRLHRVYRTFFISKTLKGLLEYFCKRGGATTSTMWTASPPAPFLQSEEKVCAKALPLLRKPFMRPEIPCCPTRPEIAQVYKDGALLVWKPVESNTPVTYFLQYRKEGEEWRALTLDISDCCYSTHNLSEGYVYSFRVACISKAGIGPYSDPSASIKISKASAGNLRLSGREESAGADEDAGSEQKVSLQMAGRRGRFSVVRQCREKSSGRPFAAKIIPYKEETKEPTLMEYLILKKLRHTNIVQLHGAFLSPRHLVLILELCDGRELLQCLSSGPPGALPQIGGATAGTTGAASPTFHQSRELCAQRLHLFEEALHGAWSTELIPGRSGRKKKRQEKKRICGKGVVDTEVEDGERVPESMREVSYSELEVQDYLWQLLSAVEFLHCKQILHLDLRSENMMVTQHKLLKILDFGDAKFYSPDETAPSPTNMDYVENMAPELLEGQGAVPPTDIWAVGITAFIMLSADHPFSSENGLDLEKAIKKGQIKFSRCYAGLSGGAVRFLQSTLWANPWGRPSASDCLKLPWLQEAGLMTLQPPPVVFPSGKLRSFLQERRKKTASKTIRR